MTGMVLLPGAGMGTWLWDKIATRLDCPSLIISPRIHPNTKEHRLAATFESIVAYHQAEIEKQNWDSTIVVGHSGAGLLAGALGKVLKGLREIVFIAANIPKNGSTALDGFPEPIRAKTREALQKQAEWDRIPISAMKDFFTQNFLNTASSEDIEYVVRQDFFPEPVCVATTAMNWDHYPSLEKTYVVCRKDKTLSVDQQRTFSSHLQIERAVEIDSDHLPMISDSESLLTILNDALQRNGKRD
jgi:hypothetical protein